MPKEPRIRVRTCSPFDEGAPVASQGIDDIKKIMKTQLHRSTGLKKYLHKCTKRCEPNKHWCSFGVKDPTICNYSTAQASNLTTHEIRAHTNVMYPCPFCGPSFEWADPAARHKHLRKVHGYEPKPRAKRDSSTFAGSSKPLQCSNHASSKRTPRRSANRGSSSSPDYYAPAFPQSTPPTDADFALFTPPVPSFPPYYNDPVALSAFFGQSGQVQQPPAISAGPSDYGNSISGVPLEIPQMMAQSQQTEQFWCFGNPSGTPVSNIGSGTWTGHLTPPTIAGYSLGHPYSDPCVSPPSQRVGDTYPVSRRPCEERDGSLRAAACMNTFNFGTGRTLGLDFGVLSATPRCNVRPDNTDNMDSLPRLLAEIDQLISSFSNPTASYHNP